MAVIALAVARGYEAPVRPVQAEVARWSFWACIAAVVATSGAALVYELLQQVTLRKLIESRAAADREQRRRMALEARFRAELEELVERRTSELLESREQLRRADRLAAIGTLAAGVAHQINNPVGSILLGAELALSTPDAEAREQAYREALEKNVTDARRCREIVRNLLAFTRVGAGEREDVDLNGIVGRAVASLREDAEAVRVRTEPEALVIHANALEIEQVVLNLITNALQAGAERVDVTTGREPGGRAVVRVEDDGDGIRPTDQPRVFDPFFSTRTRDGGTGLGLSIVHGIVTEHEGRISLDSQPGRGSRFSVELPLAEPDGPSRADGRAQSPGSSAR